MCNVEVSHVSNAPAILQQRAVWGLADKRRKSGGSGNRPEAVRHSPFKPMAADGERRRPVGTWVRNVMQRRTLNP